MTSNIKAVNAYIATFPIEIQAKLKEMRQLIKKEAPDAVEGISYGMPAYKTHNKPLVYFAAYAEHIGFYATPSGHQQFKEQLSIYKQGKGSVQFLLDQDLPLDLITEMIRFRVKENKDIWKQKQ